MLRIANCLENRLKDGDKAVSPTNPEVRVPFPALPDILRGSGSGTGCNQPPEYNWGALERKISDSGL
jgi:hypothetical protein